MSLNGAASELSLKQTGVSAGEGNRAFAFVQRNGHEHTQVNWNDVWMPFAACVLLTIALGIYAFRVSKGHSVEVPHESAGSAGARIEALEQGISDAGHEPEVLRTQLAERDKVIAKLRGQTEQQARSLNEIRGAQANLGQSLQTDETEKQRVVDERTGLAQKFDEAQSSLQKMQSELDSASAQSAQGEAKDAGLQSQIKDLSGQLREQEQTVAEQDELLSHDRDIRELMGARDLYVAEVYDIARDGSTQKSYGRVFYTQGQVVNLLRL